MTRTDLIFFDIYMSNISMQSCYVKVRLVDMINDAITCYGQQEENGEISVNVPIKNSTWQTQVSMSLDWIYIVPVPGGWILNNKCHKGQLRTSGKSLHLNWYDVKDQQGILPMRDAVYGDMVYLLHPRWHRRSARTRRILMTSMMVPLPLPRTLVGCIANCLVV